MREIRFGLEAGVDVSVYARLDFDAAADGGNKDGA